jgi:hypothetical protein
VPTSEERTKKAINDLFQRRQNGTDGLATA